PVEIGPSLTSTPGGRFALASLMRSVTCWRAKKMSVLSVKTVVIWANPLRENDRVDSSPGMPVSAVSIGNVTCFSISMGENAGAMALIWTWTLVTSGTASIGNIVRDQAPEIATARVASTTSQRRRTEN